jgi:hypothetical protein
MPGPVVIAAGGTGGHIFPAQSLAQELSRRGHKVVLMTDDRGHNYAQSFPGAQIVTVPSATFAGRGVAGKALAVLRLARDPGLRASVAGGGRSAASGFTFDAMVDGMEAFLRDGAA